MRPGRRSWKRIDTAEDTVARAAAAWLRLAPTQPQRCACQALPGVSPVSWRDFWGPGEEEQVWRGLQPHLPPTPARPRTHAHTVRAEKGGGIGELEGHLRRRDCSSESTAVPNVNRKMNGGGKWSRSQVKKKGPQKKEETHTHTPQLRGPFAVSGGLSG